MTYYPDLTEYIYFDRDAGGQNVGWLDEHHLSPTGTVPPEFLPALAKLCFSARQNQTRGLHPCPFCDRSPMDPPKLKGSESFGLGSADIHVAHPDGTVFKAPNMVHHYVEAHGYLPPTPFLEAVMKYKCEQENQTYSRIRAFLKRSF